MESGEKLVETGTPFKTDMEKMRKKIDEDNLKISNSSVEAFYSKFPFLHNYLRKSDPKEACVLSLNNKVVDMGPCHAYCTAPPIILDEGGIELTRVGAVIAPKTRWWLPAPKSQTVGEALKYLEKTGKAQTSKFVLSYDCVFRKINLYMAPKGFTIPGWLGEQVRIATTKLNEELEKIDSEAK